MQDTRNGNCPDQEILFFCCIIHQGMLCRNVLNMSHLINTVIKPINFIQARGLNRRQFISLLEDVGTEHTDVLYHSRFRWLSLGKVFKRVLDLQDYVLAH
jgi:hypothetical protein